MPARPLVMGLLISPMVTPVIISAAGMFFFYSTLGLTQTYLGLILAHAALGTPFVVITVTATLTGFDNNLLRAAASLGAGPWRSFRRVQLPIIAPGVASGALFAFATSFDEVVTVLFMGGLEQRTIPREMWAGIREQISPAILAVATLLIIFAVTLMVTVEWLRRRSQRGARLTRVVVRQAETSMDTQDPSRRPTSGEGAGAKTADVYVEFNGVHKTYDGVTPIVRDLHLTVHEGEFLTLLGPSAPARPPV